MASPSLLKVWLIDELDWAYEKSKSSAELGSRHGWMDWPPKLPREVFDAKLRDTFSIVMNGTPLENAGQHFIAEASHLVLRNSDHASFLSVRFQEPTKGRRVVISVYPKFALDDADWNDIVALWARQRFRDV
jgi:hypothetical protein